MRAAWAHIVATGKNRTFSWLLRKHGCPVARGKQRRTPTFNRFLGSSREKRPPRLLKTKQVLLTWTFTAILTHILRIGNAPAEARRTRALCSCAAQWRLSFRTAHTFFRQSRNLDEASWLGRSGSPEKSFAKYSSRSPSLASPMQLMIK